MNTKLSLKTIYNAFTRCRKVYGRMDIHVSLLAIQLNVSAIELLEYIDSNSSYFTTKTIDANAKIKDNMQPDGMYAGTYITAMTTAPFLTKSSNIYAGMPSTETKTIILSVSGDTFKTLSSTANWTVDVGLTGLTFSAVTATVGGVATLTFTSTGDVREGLISIQAKASAMTGGVASEKIYLELTENFDAKVGLASLKVPDGSPVSAVASTDTFTFGGLAPVAGDEITIGNITYTFVETLSVEATPNEVLIGTVEESRDNLISAIMLDDDENDAGVIYGDGTVANQLFGAVASGTTALIVTALVKGALGNTYAKGSSMDDSSNAWTIGGALFTLGVDGTVANAGEMLYEATKLWVAIGTCTISDSSNWKYISLT